MHQTGSFEDDVRVPAFLAGDGVTHELMRSLDWSKTPVGPIHSWPTSLKTVVGVLLHSRQPMFLWWGPELVQFYNDAYLPSFGKGKHPAAMGQRGRDCWQEIWPIIWPQIDDVMRHAKPSFNEDHLVPIFRNDRIEEVYWTYGYSPVFDETGAVGGTLVICIETTARVISARRLRTMHRLTEQTAAAQDTKTLLQTAARVLGETSSDLTFALFMSRDSRSDELLLSETSGMSADQARALMDSQLRSLLAASGQGDASDELRPIQLREPLHLAACPDPVREVFVMPLAQSTTELSREFVVFGLNPRLPFDDGYQAHLHELAEHLRLVGARIEGLRVRTQAEAERKNLLLQAPVGTALMIGPEHVFQIANPLFCQLVGRKESQLLGKSYNEAFPELIDTPLPTILDRVYQRGEPFVTNEQPLPLDRRGDGTLEDCFFKFNLEPLRDTGGEIYGMMAVAVEITEQVNARHVLEKAYQERARLLEQLEAASRAKDEFLAMLGHELRNPLTPIVTALELMKYDEGQSLRARQIIERQVGHLRRLVDDLLDIAKITRGKIELKKEWSELADVVAKAIEHASFLLEQRRHQLILDVPQSGMSWEGDPIRLAQVIANLLTNAARYTDVGGIIHVSVRREDSELVISVRDNGRGISAEMLPLIFNLFVQGQRSADRAEGGLGIGLALVKNLVSLHGGTVSASSKGAGQGSEFTVRLPASSAHSPVQASSLPATPSIAAGQPSQRLRVLVVDDNSDAAELLAQALRIFGHEVRVANDPSLALRLTETFQPAVALLDIGLPGMDGYELAASMRTKLKTANCRLLAITGYGQEHDRIRSEKAGFHAHLIKPVDLQQLMQIIAEA